MLNIFSECSGLTSVTIPNNVTSIKLNAFYGCSGLKSVHISDVKTWCKINYSHFSSNPLYYAHHLFLNNVEVKDLIIPQGVTSISEYAFYGCYGITSVTIPSSVTSIGTEAFQNCCYLNTIYSLNPTPPTCYSTSTFSCSTSYVRDKYDVYISGSDQIWNRGSNELKYVNWRKYMSPYLLEFTEKKKVSYASSICDMTDDNIDLIYHNNIH